MTTQLSSGNALRRSPSSSGPTLFPVMWAVAAFILAVALSSASFVGYRHYHPTYRATAAVGFDQPRAIAAAGDAGEIQKLSQLRLVYAGLAKTDVMTEPIAAKLKLPRGLIASSVVTTTPPQSLLLLVSAERPSTTQAKLIAEALANEIVTYVDQVQKSAKVPSLQRVQAQVVLHSHFAVQVSPTDKRRLSVAILTWIFVFVIVLGIGALWHRRR